MKRPHLPAPVYIPDVNGSKVRVIIGLSRPFNKIPAELFTNIVPIEAFVFTKLVIVACVFNNEPIVAVDTLIFVSDAVPIDAFVSIELVTVALVPIKSVFKRVPTVAVVTLIFVREAVPKVALVRDSLKDHSD
jgi:hypothetical protein